MLGWPPLHPPQRSTPSLPLKAEIARLRQLLAHYHEEIRATKELVKGTSLGLEQAELSYFKMKEEEMRIQGECDASMATDTRIARGIWRGCTCPSNQAIYNDRPTHNADLTIAQCMRTCTYCGSIFKGAAALRTHPRRALF